MKNRRKRTLRLFAANEVQLQDGTNVICAVDSGETGEPVKIRLTNPEEPDRTIIAALTERDATKLAEDIQSLLERRARLAS